MTRKRDPFKTPTKRPYRTPALTVHGSLKTLTKDKGGAANDGAGKPRTKGPGVPA
jgi:hypothetical protein